MPAFMDFWLQNGKGHVASWGVNAGVHDVHVLRRQSPVAQVGPARIPALSANMTTQCRHCSWRERLACATKACGCLGRPMHLPTRATDKPSTTMFSFSPCSKPGNAPCSPTCLGPAVNSPQHGCNSRGRWSPTFYMLHFAAQRQMVQGFFPERTFGSLLVGA